MAIQRPAPTNPLTVKHGILELSKGTYSLPKAHSRSIVSKSPDQDQLQLLKKELTKTFLVSILILGLILWVVSKLR